MNSLSLQPEGVGLPRTATPSPQRENPPEALARRLLAEGNPSRAGAAAQLGVGWVGLLLLGVITEPAFASALEPSFAGAMAPTLKSLALPLAAALTAAISLPGLLILLPMLGQRAPIEEALGSVCRQYARLGLLALGFCPLVLLYAQSGAEPGLVVVMTCGYYIGAGALSLAHLFRDVRRALQSPGLAARACLVGWALYTSALGFYLFGKFSLGAWS